MQVEAAPPCTARFRPALDQHVYGLARPVADDSQHVQDRRELTSTVFHVTARTVATHALSIFGDHSDVMACRSTGWAMLASGSVQEAQDMAAIAHAATLEARVPFVHFYDGFCISHRGEQVRAAQRRRSRQDDRHEAGSRPPGPGSLAEKPVLRGTAQNPDVFFQAARPCNPFYTAVPGIVQKTMDKFGSSASGITCSTTSALRTPSA